MPSRTQIVCLCEGRSGGSVDPVFINRLMRKIRPAWLRPWGSNVIRIESRGGRTELIRAFPDAVRACQAAGGDTTLMVWADCVDGEALKQKFWNEAQGREVSRDAFDRVVFIFAKDRLENWVEFLQTGTTDEAVEAPRVSGRAAAEAAEKLAGKCRRGEQVDNMPPSLRWSCGNWRSLASRMESG